LPLNVIQVLQDCRLFAEVEGPSFQRLVAMARLVDFPKGTLVFRDGQKCPGVYIVASGLVRVFKAGPNGKEHVLHMVGPGATFAEVAAIGGFDVPAAAEAVTASTCVLLPLDPFRRAMQEDHALCLGMMTGLAFWVKHLVGLMEDVVLRDAAGRLARYLLNAPATPEGTIELPALKRHVASHLNLTSETLSRSLRRLIDAGLLAESESNQLTILDRRKLEAIAAGTTDDDET
jgi:CRP/FNR family transcriptional regulator, dissimilatory nitrate respiration regulator